MSLKALQEPYVSLMPNIFPHDPIGPIRVHIRFSDCIAPNLSSSFQFHDSMVPRRRATFLARLDIARDTVITNRALLETLCEALRHHRRGGPVKLKKLKSADRS